MIININKQLIILSFSLFLAIANASAHNEKLNTMDSLVDVEWLNHHLHDSNIVVIDASVNISFNKEGQFSMQSGNNSYQQKHIPHAIFADLLTNLSAKDTKLNFVMPTPKNFQKALNDLGVHNSSHVVIYSTKPNQSWAQRLWWMFKWAGHENVAVLDGGFKAWVDAGFNVSSYTRKIKTSQYKLHLKKNLIANQDEVNRAIYDKTTIIDALSPSHYSGEFSMYSRSGHIKSAINAPTDSLFLESGKFKPLDQLNKLFHLNTNSRVISYCGGGVAASSIAFTLHRLGYKDVAVYMGSLQEWVTNDKNPMTIGGQ